MHRVMVLGIGLQGRAVVHDLVHNDGIDTVVAADGDAAQLRRAGPLLGRAVPATVDATDPADLARLFAAHRPHLVVGMLPHALGRAAAEAALAAGAHYVTTSYTSTLAELDGLARERGLAVLPEMGLDPGIDLVLARKAVDELDEVQALDVFGGGLPAPECAHDNPLHYKITWTFRGVLTAYRRPARLLADGAPLDVAPTEIFAPAQVRSEEFPGLGTLEVYPNGDALAFIERFGLGTGLQQMGRYSLRWPGHCALWYPLVQLGLLDEEPGPDGVAPVERLARHLEPRLQFADHERDVCVLRVRASGLRGGQPAEVVYDMIDHRDLGTGLFAMNRTVGYTAAVAAQLLLDGTIAGRGVLSPARDVPPDPVLEALAARGIAITRR